MQQLPHSHNTNAMARPAGTVARHRAASFMRPAHATRTKRTSASHTTAAPTPDRLHVSAPQHTTSTALTNRHQPRDSELRAVTQPQQT
jgi:hypothetical protein